MKRFRYLFKLVFHVRQNYSYQLGRHSGYPVCCALFWRFVWSQFGNNVVGYEEDGRPIYDARRQEWVLKHIWTPFKRGQTVNYIPCPICLVRGHFVEPHKCVPNHKICFGPIFREFIMKENNGKNFYMHHRSSQSI